jgi:hypothetical protein
MSHTITKTLAIAAVVVVILAAIVIPGYLYEIKAEAKTHSLSTSMSTSCNGGTDEPCQTIVCEDNKPCRTLDSNSSPVQQTENTTTAEQPQSSSSDTNDTTPFYKHPLFHKYRNESFLQMFPTLQMPDYSDGDGFD